MFYKKQSNNNVGTDNRQEFRKLENSLERIQRVENQTKFKVFIHGDREEISVTEGEDLQLKCSAISSVTIN